jgi:NAD(P)-dependent dehydrogenase (short-subunit alcohol dehydrogenase family)
MNLKGRRVVVTGATGGVGREVVSSLVDIGCQVLATSLSGKRSPDMAVDRVLSADLTTETGRSSLKHAVTERFGETLDVLVQCIGLAHHEPVTRISSSSWEAVHGVTASGPVLTTQRLLPHLLLGDTPQVIFVGSVLANEPMRFGAAYAAAKRSLAAYAQHLALECGDQLRVTQIHPGAIETPFLRHTTDADARAWFDSRSLQRLSPSTIAQFVTFCVGLRDRNCVVEQVVLVPHGQHSRGALDPARLRSGGPGS